MLYVYTYMYTVLYSELQYSYLSQFFLGSIIFRPTYEEEEISKVKI